MWPRLGWLCSQECPTTGILIQFLVNFFTSQMAQVPLVGGWTTNQDLGTQGPRSSFTYDGDRTKTPLGFRSGERNVAVTKSRSFATLLSTAFLLHLDAKVSGLTGVS